MFLKVFLNAVLLVLVVLDCCAQREEVELKVPVGHTGLVNGIAFSQDNKYMATASDDRTAKLWDVRTAREIKTFFDPAHKTEIQTVFFSQGGRFLYTGSKSTRGGLSVVPNPGTFLTKWDTWTGTKISSITLLEARTITVSPNGKFLFYRNASFNNVGIIYDLETGKSYGINISRYGDPFSFSPDSKFLLALKEEYFSWPQAGQSSMIANIQIEFWNLDTLRSNYKSLGKPAAPPIPERVFSAGPRIENLSVSANGNYLAVCTKNFIKVWNTNNKLDTMLLTAGNKKFRKFQFSADGKRLLAYASDQTSARMYVWKLNPASASPEVADIPYNANTSMVAFSPDGGSLYFQQGETVFALQVESKTIVKEFSGHSFPTVDYFFDKDKSRVITVYDNLIKTDSMNKLSKAIVAEVFAKGGTRIGQYTKDSMTRLNDSKFTLFSGKKNRREWDFRTGEVFSYTHDSVTFAQSIFTDNGSHQLACDLLPRNSVFASWFSQKLDPERLKQVSKENPSFDSVAAKIIFDTAGLFYKAYFDPNSLFTRILRPEVKLTNKKTNNTVSLIAIDTADWVIADRLGYFMASRNGARNLHYLKGNKVYLFEQFDLQYNRPDIILEEIGMATPERIEIYKKAYEKRLQRLGFSPGNFDKEQSFNVPNVEILNPYALPSLSREPVVKLNISASDSAYTLDRINVWDNGVPVYGTAGLSVKSKNSNSWQQTISVPLLAGRNKIQLSATNSKGVESYRDQVDINFQPAKPIKSKVYFVGIGVADYEDSQYKLVYAAKDIRDLSAVVKEKYPAAIIDTLINEQVTRENILALRQKLRNTGVDDKVIVSISGHGLLDTALNFYYATHDMNFSVPQQNGVLYEELEGLLDDIPARKKLLLIDACHGGEVDKTERASTSEAPKNAALDKRVKEVYRGGRGVDVSNSGVGLQNSFELMQQLFADLNRGNGAQVVSAAAGNGYALEDDKWQNGVFTYCVLKALKEKEADANNDGAVTVNELKVYVSSQVEQLTGGQQKPTSRKENLDFDWVLW